MKLHEKELLQYAEHMQLLLELILNLKPLVFLCIVGLHKILSLLESEDVDVRVHAVKVVANLAAEGNSPPFLIFTFNWLICWKCNPFRAESDPNALVFGFSEANQEKIVEAGGLGSLLMLLQSSEDETIRRVAAGAVANLAMNGNPKPTVTFFLLGGGVSGC